MSLAVLDLFSGIGGFSLGLERTGGFVTLTFCEIDPYPRAVLLKHWPKVPIHHDVRTLHIEPGIFDVLCGGFPCQDISLAGQGAGLDGARSGLWWEFYRLIQEGRPRYVIIENVSALRGRGLDIVLGALAALGYDAEWHCLPASAVGAHHQRDRIWVVAYPRGEQHQGGGLAIEWPRAAQLPEADMAHADRLVGVEGRQDHAAQGQGGRHADRGGLGQDGVANAGDTGFPLPQPEATLTARRWQAGRAATQCGGWSAEPDVGRVAHGVPSRVDRLKCLGNAVVPQVTQAIGHAILLRELLG